jgi:hypothetical protein
LHLPQCGDDESLSAATLLTDLHDLHRKSAELGVIASTLTVY